MVRDYEPQDLEAVKKIHNAMELNYDFPDLNSPLCIVKKVQVEGGRVQAAMILRLTCETFLLVEGDPVAKMTAMNELQPVVLDEAFRKGLDDVVAVIPPKILPKFLKRLLQLGWTRDRDWPMFSRATRPMDEERNTAGTAGRSDRS
jgi:hypothetical protein